MCPSDPVNPKVVTAGWSESPGGQPQNSQGWSGNYAGCAGSEVFNPPEDRLGQRRNGIFYAASKTRITDIKDGTSNTLMIGEYVLAEDVMSGLQVSGGDSGSQQLHDKHGRYWNSHQGNALFSTLNPPNTTVGDRGTWCIDRPPHKPCQSNGRDNVVNHLRSHHTGGVNAAMADGSVHFIGEFVDVIVFRAFGTRSGNEAVERPF